MIAHQDQGLLASELSGALSSLPVAELDAVLGTLEAGTQRQLLDRLDVMLEVSELHNGLPQLIVDSLPVLDLAEERELAALVARTLLPDATDFDAVRALITEGRTEPSTSALRVAAIVAAFDRPADARDCLDLLDAAPALQLPWPGVAPDPMGRGWRERIRLLHTVSTHGLEQSVQQTSQPHHPEETTGAVAPPSVGGIDETLQRADGLFTAVDHVMLRATLAVAGGVQGAPTPRQLAQAVEDFVRLNADRRSSYFHLGFLVAARAAPTSVGRLQGDRLRWFQFGRICGLIHAGDEAQLVTDCIEHRRTVAELITHRQMGAIVLSGVIRAMMIDHAPIAAELLTARVHPFHGALDLYRDVYWRARMLVISERSAEAEPLFAALGGLPLRIHDIVAERQRHADLVRRRVNCKRSLDDFASAAALLDTVELEDLDDRTLAEHHAERGLVAARIRHLSHLSFPSDEPERGALRERLAGAEKHFASALQHDPQDLRATYALGVLATCERDHHAAAGLLERAEAGLMTDPVLSRTALVMRTRFHRAVETLALLEAGTDAAAVDSAVRSLREGYRPPLATVLEAIDALETHGSRHTACFVGESLAALDDLEPLVPTLVRLLPEHPADLLPAVQPLLGRPRLSLTARFDLHVAAMRTAARSGDEDGHLHTVESLDDLVTSACDVGLDRAWADLLDSDTVLRETLDPAEADLLRAGVLQRIGELDEARQVVVQLFYRIAQGSLERYDPEDLLELLDRLGADEDQLAPLRRLVRSATVDTEQLTLTRPVHIIFAGGNETQERSQGPIEEALAERYGDRLTLQWFSPGWDMNWIKDAERIEAAMPAADAIVILTYMRTNLGRRLRKAANQHGLVWRSCTGQGRASMERSIESALEGVLTNGTATAVPPSQESGKDRS
jgi:tetratricopeptide (TPR) repeat protein